jgi:alkaline phosphatase
VSISWFLKVAAVLGAVAVFPLAACSSDSEKASNGNPVARAAKGDLATNGSARQFDGDQSQAIRDTINASGAKNVILLIGDGMGDSEITIARNYEKGAGGFFTGLDALPLTGQYTTYALRKDGKPNYVTDSAASATAWSTGTKTYNGALGIDIKNAPQKTILELAKDQGFATGDITTSEIQDATPAALFSHITERDCYGPTESAKDCGKEALENGGPGSVTEQMLATKPDIVVGGGGETFAQTANGRRLQGQDTRGPGQGAWLPDRLYGKRIGCRDEGRPRRAAARTVRRRQHAGELDGARRGSAGLPAARGQVHRQPRPGCAGAGTRSHDAEDDRPALGQ